MKFRLFLFLIVVLSLASCKAQSSEEVKIKSLQTSARTQISEPDSLYKLISSIDSKSVSKGTVSNGSLENGKILPFSGKNFHYFDTNSYLMKRGFMHEKVRNALLHSYSFLEKENDLNYGLMECSNEHGGKIEPHRTHQNGLSVDFMSPLLRNGAPCYDYDFTGGMHYLMDFDDNGNYLKDKNVSINFEAIAMHLLVLNESAAKEGLKIEKVIWK